MIKHIQTSRRLKAENCFGVFDYFEELPIKGLSIQKWLVKLLLTWILLKYIKKYLLLK